jgi:hypothetical protein
MSRRAAKFSQTDVTRAIRAAVKAGLNVTGYRIDDEGRIEVSCGEPSPAPEPSPGDWRGRLREKRGWDQ